MEENKPQRREGGGHAGSGGRGGLSEEGAFELSPRCGRSGPGQACGERTPGRVRTTASKMPPQTPPAARLPGEQQLLGCSFPAPASALCLGAGVGWGVSGSQFAAMRPWAPGCPT